jgi:hypothetical protein
MTWAKVPGASNATACAVPGDRFAADHRLDHRRQGEAQDQ